MPDLLDLIRDRLDDRALDDLSRRAGADRDRTEQAIGALLPVLVGALAGNARDPQERSGLDRALERDHDGSLLDALPGLLGQSDRGGGGGLSSIFGQLLSDRARGLPAQRRERALDGEGIVRHVLGERRGSVERGVGNASGLDPQQVSGLLATLAPVVMGALGKAKRERGLDADGVAELLERERKGLEREAPGEEPAGLMALLDSNRDGKVDLSDDIAKVGAALGAAWWMSRRGKKEGG